MLSQSGKNGAYDSDDLPMVVDFVIRMELWSSIVVNLPRRDGFEMVGKEAFGNAVRSLNVNAQFIVCAIPSPLGGSNNSNDVARGV